MGETQLDIRGPVHGTKDVGRAALGSTAGAVIESYDFIGFGTAAALYFGTAFFHAEDPMVGVLASFATLGVGFVARPFEVGDDLGDAEHQTQVRGGWLALGNHVRAIVIDGFLEIIDLTVGFDDLLDAAYFARTVGLDGSGDLGFDQPAHLQHCRAQLTEIRLELA